jgi:hypothetical protein
VHAIVHGPNKENNEMSVNIEITNKKLFLSGEPALKSKPPTIPPKVALKHFNNENVDSSNR